MDDEAKAAAIAAADGDDNAEVASKAMEELRQAQQMEAAEEAQANAPRQMWVPGMQLADGEELVMDQSAYVMYHALRPEWPSLSFDIIRDGLGERRGRFPHTMYMAMGSQASRPQDNKITIMKLSDLHRTQAPDESDAESGDDDDHLDEDPVLETRNLRHRGGVNRLRSCPQRPQVLATFADTGHVHVFDAGNAVRSFEERGVPPQSQKAIWNFSHRDEGYALDWSPMQEGRFATGDNKKIIHVHSPRDGGAAWGSSQPMKGHTAAVEDIQFSPSEATVFASCGCDGTVRIWDVRNGKGPMITVAAHIGTDVNVISWNRNMEYLLASGADDGGMKIWDLRSISAQEAAPIAHYTYHQEPITSLEWHPTDESVLAVSSDDDQLSIWDLSVEEDEEAMQAAAAPSVAESVRALPPQLLFIHQGQHLIKELHFHPQIPGAIVTTAFDSLNVFKPATAI
mmetsp:Transcript_44520/g.139647  ORF Transcript_44520/g.139647 Transcript_44520/m.139647 type:complete len:455 (-) Transcript_44520:1166-2530(-)